MENVTVVASVRCYSGTFVEIVVDAPKEPMFFGYCREIACISDGASRSNDLKVMNSYVSEVVSKL